MHRGCRRDKSVHRRKSLSSELRIYDELRPFESHLEIDRKDAATVVILQSQKKIRVELLLLQSLLWKACNPFLHFAKRDYAKVKVILCVF